MGSYKDEPEEIRIEIRKRVTEEIIKKYLAIQRSNGNKDDVVYRLKKSNYEKLYNALDPKLREECEARINKEIKEGKLNLDSLIEKINGVEDRGER